MKSTLHKSLFGQANIFFVQCSTMKLFNLIFVEFFDFIIYHIILVFFFVLPVCIFFMFFFVFECKYTTSSLLEKKDKNKINKKNTTLNKFYLRLNLFCHDHI